MEGKERKPMVLEGEDLTGKYDFSVDIGDDVEYSAMGVAGIVSGLCVYINRSMGVCLRYMANGEIKDLWLAIDDIRPIED